VTGLSCLADGADQIFARAVTDLCGTLEVVPAAGYRAGLPADSPPGYDALFGRRRPFTASTPHSHVAASRLMVDDADELYAVWDGKPARVWRPRRPHAEHSEEDMEARAAVEPGAACVGSLR
jgi:hypothetical protein